VAVLAVVDAALSLELQQIAHQAVLVHQILQIVRQVNLAILGEIGQVAEYKFEAYLFGALLFLLRKVIFHFGEVVLADGLALAFDQLEYLFKDIDLFDQSFAFAGMELQPAVQPGNAFACCI
jgi:hypothetical protein